MQSADLSSVLLLYNTNLNSMIFNKFKTINNSLTLQNFYKHIVQNHPTFHSEERLVKTVRARECFICQQFITLLRLLGHSQCHIFKCQIIEPSRHSKITAGGAKSLFCSRSQRIYLSGHTVFFNTKLNNFEKQFYLVEGVQSFLVLKEGSESHNTGALS